jgi:hypothetical protein
MINSKDLKSVLFLIIGFLIGSVIVYLFYEPIGIVVGGLLIIFTPLIWNYSTIEQGDFSLKNGKFWVIFLLALFTFFNLISFYVYQESHPLVDVWNQIWGFFESGFFGIIAASILLPLLLFIFESIFKIREKDEEKRLTKQLGIIQENQKMWRTLIDLTGKVKYFEKNNDKNENIREILHELDNFTVSVDEFLVEMSEFSLLISSEDLEKLLDPVRFLYYSTLSVANYIESNDSDDVDQLKLSLNEIEEGLVYIHHTTTGTILNDYFYLDSNALENRIRRYKFHYDYVEYYRKLIIKYNDFLPIVSETGGVKGLKDLRKSAKNLEKWLKEDHERNIIDYDNLSEFRKQYIAMRFELRKNNLKPVIFSKEFIHRFADYLSFNVALNKLNERGFWQKEDPEIKKN